MNKERSIKSARRALAVLDLFEKLRRPAKVGEVASLLGYPQSSTSFLMNDLRKLGYLNHDPDTRCFAPTMRVALLGGWIHAGTVGRTEIFELVADISELTRLTGVLCTQNGTEVQYIHVAPRFAPSTLELRPGALRPICRSAAGIILLAKQTDPQIDRLIRSINASSPPGARESPAKIMRLVQDAREHNYAWLAGGIFPHAGSVAVPLPFNDVLNKPLILAAAGAASTIRAKHRDIAAILKEQIATHCSGARADQ